MHAGFAVYPTSKMRFIIGHILINAEGNRLLVFNIECGAEKFHGDLQVMVVR